MHPRFIAGKQIRTLWLPEALLVLLLYMSVQVDDQGQFFSAGISTRGDKAVCKARDPSAPPIPEPEIHQSTG